MGSHTLNTCVTLWPEAAHARRHRPAHFESSLIPLEAVDISSRRIIEE